MKPFRAVTAHLLLAGAFALNIACGSSASNQPAGQADDGGSDSADAAGTAEDGAVESGTSGTDADASLSDDGGGLGFAPSNVPMIAPPSLVADVTVSSPNCTVDTDKLTVDCVAPNASGALPYAFVTANQSDGSQVAVLEVQSLTISAAASLTLTGGVPLIVWARTRVNIQGPFIADPAFHFTNGGGAVPTQSGSGGGPGGGLVGTSNPQVGASGGGYCGVGGAGGNSQIVNADSGAPLAGGRSYGNATITPLAGGSSGGSVPGQGGGGEGGGAIEITAGESILIGAAGIVSVPGYGCNGNGGGGGSGGAILLEAPSVTVDGTLAANGGGACVFSGGGGAQDGQPNTQPAKGQDANCAVGSADTQINGGDGVATTVATSSGGGAAGRIRINTQTGTATIGSSATLSPAPTTACATQGTLTKSSK